MKLIPYSTAAKVLCVAGGAVLGYWFVKFLKKLVIKEDDEDDEDDCGNDTIELEMEEPFYQEIIWSDVSLPEGYFRIREIHGFLEKAQKSIEICLNKLDCELLERVLENLAENDVVVKIITEIPMANEWHMRDKGIRIRTNEHNADAGYQAKFFIIDGKLVMYGSLGWTWSTNRHMKGITAISNNARILMMRKAEFKKVWKANAESEENANYNRFLMPIR